MQRAVAQLGLQLALLGRVADAQHEAAHGAVGRRSATPTTTGSQKPRRVAHAKRDLAGGCGAVRPSSAFASSGWASSASRRAAQALGPAPEDVAHRAR